MTEKNERMRAALREIESRAIAALVNQPNDANECWQHLNKALAGIELKAHVARWGQTQGGESAAGAVAECRSPETGKPKRLQTP